jgi:hypothetical protein
MPTTKKAADLPAPATHQRWLWRETIIASLAIVGVTVLLLRIMGRRWWCECGTPHLFVNVDLSTHNSQHLLDPYTFSHVQHGLLLYALLFIIARRLSPAFRALVAIAVECVWEVLENTSWIIDRYRDSTAALDYYGDSIVNSVADIGACALGYGIAASLPVFGSVLGFVAIEVAMIFWIRDSLLLNVLMLCCPIEAIRRWQIGG